MLFLVSLYFVFSFVKFIFVVICFVDVGGIILVKMGILWGGVVVVLMEKFDLRGII